MMNVRKELQEQINGIVRNAGARILVIREAGLNPEKKQDNTPVTEADIAADKIISEGLKRCAPGIAIISEEGGALPDPETLPETFWLVDPLDGTRGFIRGNPDFTVNVALIVQRRPVYGVIYAPMHDELYAGQKGEGAYLEKNGTRQKISVNASTEPGSALISSQHSVNENTILTTAFPGIAIRPQSSSIKFCRVAEGKADVYFRAGQTSEWDTAAGQAILEAAGGAVYSYPEGKEFIYAKPRYLNSGIVAGHPAAVSKLLDFIQERFAEASGL